MASVLACAASPPPPSLCNQGEQVVFNCAVGKKSLSFCASGQLTKASGTLQYRFGRPNAVELTFPADGAKHADSLEIAKGHLVRAGGHYAVTYINFKNADTLYSFEWNEDDGASIEMLTKGKPFSLKCAPSSTTTNLELLNPVLDSQF